MSDAREESKTWFKRPDLCCYLCNKAGVDPKHWPDNCDALPKPAGETDELRLIFATDQTQVFRLQFLARPTATFGDLDTALLRYWLECCGHLSQFAVLQEPQPGVVPQNPVSGVFFFGAEPQRLRIISSEHAHDEDALDNGDVWSHQDRERLCDRLGTPLTLAQHCYDFGSTTCTNIVAGPKVRVPTVAATRLLKRGQRLLLVGRNERPQIPCATCGSPSLFVRNCESNFWEKSPEDFWCSRQCAAEGAEPYQVCRFWNSPRAGVCGYDGPQNPGDEENLWEDDDTEGDSDEWTTDDGEGGSEEGGDESGGDGGGQATPAKAAAGGQRRTRARG